MQIRVALAMALLFAGTCAVAQETKAPAAKSLEELDRRVAKVLQDEHVPGGAIIVIENGQVVLARNYGFADVAAQRPVTADTVFRAGSISKSFVGIAVMMLVEEGKLDLDAKLSELAPEIKFDNPWEATDPVRLVHLLEHTTGFDDVTFHHYGLEGDLPFAKVVELYGPYRSRWKPGTYASYCNSAPVIAAYLVERASGMSWAEFTRKRIFEPLGMTSAHWTPAPEIRARLSKSYDGENAEHEDRYRAIIGKPTGGLNISASDLAKLALFLINRGNVNGVQLLKPESVTRIETTTSTLASRHGLSLGYGLGNEPIPGEKAVFRGHGGEIGSFVAHYVYNAEHKAGALMMVNADRHITRQVMEEMIFYLERDWPKPAVVEVQPSASDLESLAGYYQTITPRRAMIAPLEHLSGWTPVEAKNGALWIHGTPRHAVGPGLFQRDDMAVPNVVFVDTPEGPQMLSALSADRRVPMFELAVKAFGAALYLALVVFALIYGLVWIVGLFRGTIAERGGVLVRLLPTMALGAPVLLILMFGAATAGGSRAIVTLGTPSLTAQSLMYLSYAIPVLGILTLLIAFLARGAPGWLRGFAVLAALVTFGITAFLWPYGWIGLKTWP